MTPDLQIWSFVFFSPRRSSRSRFGKRDCLDSRRYFGNRANRIHRVSIRRVRVGARSLYNLKHLVASRRCENLLPRDINVSKFIKQFRVVGRNLLGTSWLPKDNAFSTAHAHAHARARSRVIITIIFIFREHSRHAGNRYRVMLPDLRF